MFSANMSKMFCLIQNKSYDKIDFNRALNPGMGIYLVISKTGDTQCNYPWKTVVVKLFNFTFSDKK